jgi:hypothetical protein
MNVGGGLVLLVWALATISVWCNAVYGVWLTHADSVAAKRQRFTKLGLDLGEPLGLQRLPLIISYGVRFVLAIGSTVVWFFALGWLL